MVPAGELMRAEPADAPELQAVFLAAKAHWGYPADWMARLAQIVVVTPAYVAGNDTWKLVGDGRICAWTSLHFHRDTVTLDNLWVRPDCMNRGLGRRLFTHAVERCRVAGAARMTIEADPNATGFYEHMGARVIGQVRTEMERDVPLLELDVPSFADR